MNSQNDNAFFSASPQTDSTLEFLINSFLQNNCLILQNQSSIKQTLLENFEILQPILKHLEQLNLRFDTQKKESILILITEEEVNFKRIVLSIKESFYSLYKSEQDILYFDCVTLLAFLSEKIDSHHSEQAFEEACTILLEDDDNDTQSNSEFGDSDSEEELDPTLKTAIRTVVRIPATHSQSFLNPSL